MFEQLAPYRRPSAEDEQPESFPSSSALELGGNANRDGDIFTGNLRWHKRNLKAFFGPATLASALAVIFLVSHCQVWSGGETSGLLERRLASGEDGTAHEWASGMMPLLCGDTKEAVKPAGLSAVSDVPTPAEAGTEPTAIVAEPDEPLAKRAKIVLLGSSGEISGDQGKAERSLEQGSDSSTALFQGVALHNTVHETSSAPYSSFDRPDGMAEVERDEFSAFWDKHGKLASPVSTASFISEQSSDHPYQSEDADLTVMHPSVGARTSPTRQSQQLAEHSGQSGGTDWTAMHPPAAAHASGTVESEHSPDQSDQSSGVSWTATHPPAVAHTLAASHSRSAPDTAEDSYDAKARLQLQAKESSQDWQHSATWASDSLESNSVSFDSQPHSLMRQKILSDTPVSTLTEAQGTSTQDQALHGSSNPQAIVSPSDPVLRVGESTTQEASTSDPSYTNHPYYRLPTVPEIMDLEPLDENYGTFSIPSRRLSSYLIPMRDLFVKQSLTNDEVQSLIHHTEDLLNYVSKFLGKTRKASRKCHAVSILAGRFLVLDALYCACLLGARAMRKELWWDSVLAPLFQPVGEWNDTSKPKNFRHAVNRRLGKHLSAAIEQYRLGRRPDAIELIQLKREIFLVPRQWFLFQEPEWNSWREDDKASLQVEDPAATTIPLTNSPATPQASNQASTTTLHLSGPAATAGQTAVKGPSTSLPAYTRHLYYRLPTVPRDMQLEALDIHYASRSLPAGSLVTYLDPMRSLLTRERLTSGEVQSLIHHAENLLNFVSKRLSKRSKEKQPPLALAVLAGRFLLLDALWCACALAGPAMKKVEWWNSALAPLFEPLREWEVRIKVSAGIQAENARVSKRLAAAIERYRTGERPEAMEVVELKRAIFLVPRQRFTFRKRDWNSWRNDNKASVHSANPEPTTVPFTDSEALPKTTNQGLPDAASPTIPIAGSPGTSSSSPSSNV